MFVMAQSYFPEKRNTALCKDSYRLARRYGATQIRLYIASLASTYY